MTANPVRPREFRVSVPDATIERIIGRVRDYQFPPLPADEGGSWSYGVNSAWLRGLCAYWTADYDWRAAEARLNQYPQYLVDLDGVELHFVKVEGESVTPTAVARFPYEYVASTPPRRWVERYFNVVRWTEMASGGHFPALERPEMLLADVRAFARQVGIYR